MTSSTTPTPTSSPGLLGISHVGITVVDIAAAQQFWTQVLGFHTLIEGPSLVMLIEPAARLAVAFTDQGGTANGPFDETRVGMDHLALAVADVATLHKWAERLNEHQVRHDGITSSDAGEHLNFRAPDNFPIELFVLSEAGAVNLGLVQGDSAAAATHELPDLVS